MNQEFQIPVSFYSKLIIIGGFTLLLAVMIIVFAMIIFAMKRRAAIEHVKKWFWDEPRPNGKHKKEEHGAKYKR